MRICEEHLVKFFSHRCFIGVVDSSFSFIRFSFLFSFGLVFSPGLSLKQLRAKEKRKHKNFKEKRKYDSFKRIFRSCLSPTLAKEKRSAILSQELYDYRVKQSFPKAELTPGKALTLRCSLQSQGTASFPMERRPKSRRLSKQMAYRNTAILWPIFLIKLISSHVLQRLPIEQIAKFRSSGNEQRPRA